MKSTGLFGKNSGRVGGVVYSNFRGQQVVRAYQPQVKNPNTKKQIAQRAKFKLVSQVGASLGKEISMSLVPADQKESSRNAFVRIMLKKAVYSNNVAILPIEDIVLTDSRVNGFLSISATSGNLSGLISPNFGPSSRVRVVVLGYSDGGEIVQVESIEPEVTTSGEFRSFSARVTGGTLGLSNIRALAYVYEPSDNSSVQYDDYSVLGDDATLEDYSEIRSAVLQFSATENIAIPQEV